MAASKKVIDALVAYVEASHYADSVSARLDVMEISGDALREAAHEAAGFASYALAKALSGGGGYDATIGDRLSGAREAGRARAVADVEEHRDQADGTEL